MSSTSLGAAAAVVLMTGCFDGGAAGKRRVPDVAPVLLNAEPPFRYPASLWAQRVQGNVTLRVFIDTTGHPAPDSTVIAESSGIAELDSAAVAGVRSLRFRPALLENERVSVSLLLPVFFRHPDAPPLPGDSAIRRTPTAPRQE